LNLFFYQAKNFIPAVFSSKTGFLAEKYGYHSKKLINLPTSATLLSNIAGYAKMGKQAWR
jgi:hypothetical protein